MVDKLSIGKCDKVLIRQIKKNDIRDIVVLQKEFDKYLQNLSNKRRQPFSPQAYTRKLLKYGFGRERAFQGFIATREGEALGYVFYHLGYDPDEMQGRVIYIVDIFVGRKARRAGIGSLLMKKVAEICKNANGTDIYFGVWLKNKAAIKFYRKLGAKLVKDVPFMRWNRSRWR